MGLRGSALALAIGAFIAPTWGGAQAEGHPALQVFAENCFSPFMTVAKAEALLTVPGARFDFYDLDPFSNADPSPATGRAVTPGTNRRCEVAFDGEDVPGGTDAVARALATEGISTEAAVPDKFPRIEGTAFIAARQLNPNRIAVVQVGTRPGPNGIETFLNVERLPSP